jgi:predicted transposase YbfD/YdcC
LSYGRFEVEMIKQIEEGFLDYFKDLEDPRSTRNRLYSMSEILLATLSGAICGAEGWEDVEIFGKAKIEFLKQYLPYKNGIPSDDTFRRFFRAINPEMFQELFRNWVKSLNKSSDGNIIAIDGKASRHSYDASGNMLHMISAFATEARLVLGQEKVADKSNEITAIPKLLDYLDIRGAIVTIDAMGCQYKIADKVMSKDGNYIFSLKGNQESLSDDVKLYFEELGLAESQYCEDYDKGHGRIETRKCWVSHDIQWLRLRHPNWLSISSIICIESTREIRGKSSTEMRYYVSSLAATPQKMLASIRSHWAIENSLHWVLDMSFGDDQSRIRKENAPQVMAVIRHIALNLLQLTKRNAEMPRISIKALRKLAGWSDNALSLILQQNFS